MHSDASRPPLSSASLPLLCMAIPALAAAVWFVALEATLPPPGANDGEPLTLTEAVAGTEIDRAFAFFHAGQDPNAPIPLRDAQMTGGEEIRLTPILVAVAAGRDDMVMMLLSSGVRMEAPGNRFAACLAARMGHTDLLEDLVRFGYGGNADAVNLCPPEPPPPDAPLRAYVE